MRAAVADCPSLHSVEGAQAFPVSVSEAAALRAEVAQQEDLAQAVSEHAARLATKVAGALALARLGSGLGEEEDDDEKHETP